jgi:hypothetical protein
MESAVEEISRMSVLALATLADGRLQTFFVDGRNTLWSQWQVDDGSDPPDWEQAAQVVPSPGPVTGVAVTTAPHGGVTVMVAKTDGTFAISSKPGPNPNAGWSPWESI